MVMATPRAPNPPPSSACNTLSASADVVVVGAGAAPAGAAPSAGTPPPAADPPNTGPPSDSATSATTAGGDTISEDAAKVTLAEPVLKCVRALETAETDTEKLAALFLVPKLVKGADCDKSARLCLMKGIGFPFLARMLRSKDSPDGCPRLMFQSVALSVLSCFAGEEEIMTNASVLFNLPVLLDIVTDADNPIYEENLLIVNDAYEILGAIVSYEQGRSAFVGNRGVHFLCDICIGQAFQCERALALLIRLLRVSGKSCWQYHNGAEDFTNLMVKFCTEFVDAQDLSKFELCETLRVILRSFPKCHFDEEPWMSKLQRGLRDILYSKIAKEQRDPAIKLVAAVIELSDFEWCLGEEGLSTPDPDRGRFLLIILNLACIEVIMHLEEQALHSVLQVEADETPGEGSRSSSSADLLVACYSILESAVAYMAGGRFDTLLDERQKSQLYTALKNAFSSVLKFVSDTSLTLKDDPKLLDEPRTRHFVCATVRILSAWLSEETAALREDVCNVLEFVVTLSVETFEAQKSLPGRTSSSYAEDSSLSSRQDYDTTPDVLRFLLPGLCHLVTEERPRSVLLDRCGLHETLYAYLSYHWAIYDSFKRWLNEQAEAKDSADVSEPSYLLDNARYDLSNSKFALASVANILMNVVVLEPDFVDRNPVFFHLLKFLVNTLPTLENRGEELVLCGNLTVLGLLVLKNHSRRPSSTDYSIFKFIQAVIRFFWDAHNCDESPDGTSLVVSSAYEEHWSDLEELWFLGMQVFSSLFEPVPWIGEFVSESGWTGEILRTLSKVKKSGLGQQERAAFQDMLCSLVRSGGEDVAEDLVRAQGAAAVCQTHGLRQLQAEIAKTRTGKTKQVDKG